MSTSFVTLDKISPKACLSKYLSGNLFIFVDMFVRKPFASLFALVAIIKLAQKSSTALIRYKHIINIAMLPIFSKFIPVLKPAVIVSVNSESLFGPIIAHTELAIPNIIAII